MSEQNAEKSEGTPIAGEVTVESLAKEAGWVPPEEYEGREGRPAIGAAAYLKKGLEIRGSMKTRIDRMGNELVSVKDAMGKLSEHYERKTKTEIAKVRKELQEKKEAAIEEGDKAAVAGVDKELDDLREEEHAVVADRKAGETTGAKSDVFVDWQDSNDWYGKNKAMSVVAEQAAAEYADEHPGAAERKVLEHAEKTVKKEFPYKFTAATDATADPVQGAQRTAGHRQNKSFTANDLSVEQRQVIDTMIKGGAPISEKDYIADLVKMGELK